MTPRFLKAANEKAFTLLEVLMSLVIFSIVLAGAAPAFIMNSKLNTFAELRSQAQAAAELKLDALRFSDPQDLPTTGQTGPENLIVGNRTFQVTTLYCSPNTYCTTNTRQLKVTVTYKNKTQYAVETVFTKLK